MRNKATNIAWKFANKLRDKYSANRVVTAMIAYIYLVWTARNKDYGGSESIHLINNALDTLRDDFDEKQFSIFEDSIHLLQNEVRDLFNEDFFDYLSKAEDSSLRDILTFLVNRTGEIESEFNDFTNEGIVTLFADKISEGSYQKILDPCFGSGQLFVELAKKGLINPQKVTVHGVEKNPRVSFIAHVNLKVNGFQDFIIDTNDILKQDLGDEYYDLIISDLPLGFRLRDRSYGAKDVPANWRFYHLLFQKTLQKLKNFGDAYFTSSAHMVRDLNRYSKDKQVELQMFKPSINYVQNLAEILDASNFAGWSYTSIPLYLLVFKNTINQDLRIKKIAASNKEECTIAKSVWYFYDYISDPSFFLSHTFKEIEQKGRDKFFKLEKFFKKSSKYVVLKNDEMLREKKSFQTLPSKIFHDISGWKKIGKDDLEKTKDPRERFELAEPGSWIIIPAKEGIKVAYLDVDSEVLIPRHLGAIKPKPHLRKLDKEWLKGSLLSTFVQEQIKGIRGKNVSRVISANRILDNILIPPQSEEEKEKFLSNWQERRIEELEEKQEKIKEDYQDVVKKKEEDKLSEEFDLIHELQHTLKNDITSIKGAVESIEKYLKRKAKTGEKVDLNEAIKNQRAGADPKLSDTVRERFNMLNNVTESMSKLLKNYKEILKFNPKRHEKEWITLKDFFEKYGKGYDKFNFEVKEEFDLPKNEREIEHFELKADREVLRLVFQNIISNAIDHGFTNEDEKYSFVVEIKDTTDHDRINNATYGKDELEDWFLEIVFKNDGNPILEEISESDFFVRGKGGPGNSSGLGGYHIKKGVESMGGTVQLLEPEDESPYQTQILVRFSFSQAVYKSPNYISVESL